jgi:hypothetical protein
MDDDYRQCQRAARSSVSLERRADALSAMLFRRHPEAGARDLVLVRHGLAPPSYVLSEQDGTHMHDGIS